jgi:hypothetical protein
VWTETTVHVCLSPEGFLCLVLLLLLAAAAAGAGEEAR